MGQSANKKESHTARLELVLKMCKLVSVPYHTLLSFQTKERPNQFYPIRFPIPKGLDLDMKSILDPVEGWVVVVIEFTANKPTRWARFNASDFRQTQWINDQGRMSVTVSAGQVTKAMISVEGDGMALLPEPSLREWMQTRNKENPDEV